MSGHHFIQSTVAARPVWNASQLNGLPVATFSKTANASIGQSLAMNVNVQDIWTINVDANAYYAIVARYTNASQTGGHYLISMREADQTALCFTLRIGGGPPPTSLFYTYRNLSNNAIDLATTVPAVNVWFFAEWQKSGANVIGRLNGAQVVSATNARAALIRTQNQVAPLYIGARPASGSGLTGDIAEVLIAKQVPDSTMLASYYSHVATTYGLSLP